MYQKAFKAYESVNKSTMSGRDVEAEALTKAALKLKVCQDHWEENIRNAKLHDALKYNQRIWTILQAELERSENPLPIDLKRPSSFYDAMNKGISRATGEIVAILNSDDIWMPNTLGRVAEAFSCNPDAGMVSGSIEVWEDLPGGANVVLRSSLLHLHKGMTVQHPATFVRRNVYERVGLFDTRYRIGDDYDFVLRCLKANIPWIILSDILVRMRAGGKGGSTFSMDDWRIRRSYKLSSPITEIVAGATGFARHVVRQFIVRVFGKIILSTFRGHLWKKRIYR